MARIAVGEPKQLEEVKYYCVNVKKELFKAYRMVLTPIGKIQREGDRRWSTEDGFQFITIDQASEHLNRKWLAEQPRAGDRLKPGEYRLPPIESVERGENGHVTIHLRSGEVVTLVSD